jgi:hypothetical protein
MIRIGQTVTDMMIHAVDLQSIDVCLKVTVTKDRPVALLLIPSPRASI